LFVLKQIFKDKLSRSVYCQAAQESLIHRQLDHTNVVKLLDFRETDTCFEMVLERCDDPLYFEDKIHNVSGIAQRLIVIPRD